MAVRKQTDEEIRTEIVKLRAEIREEKRLLEIAKAKTARMQAEYDATKPRPAIGLREALRRNIRGEVTA